MAYTHFTVAIIWSGQTAYNTATICVGGNNQKKKKKEEEGHQSEWCEIQDLHCVAVIYNTRIAVTFKCAQLDLASSIFF